MGQKTPTKQSKLQQKINLSLTIVVLVLFVTLPPILCGLFYLSRVPDITWGSDDGLTYSHIWMHRERRPVGIGYQRQRVIAEYSWTEVCVETCLRFFLWGSSSRAQPSISSREMVLVDNRWQPSGEECR